MGPGLSPQLPPAWKVEVGRGGVVGGPRWSLLQRPEHSSAFPTRQRCVWRLVVQCFGGREGEGKMCVVKPIFCFLLVCWDQVVASDTENVLCLNSKDHPQIQRMMGRLGAGL